MTTIAVVDHGINTLVLQHRSKLWLTVIGSVLLLGLLMALSIGRGAVNIPLFEVVQIIAGWFVGSEPSDSRHVLVVTNIRMPRTLLAALVGAALALSGAVMQGLFRNPLADPGLVGVSGGAALAVGVTIVLGDRLFGTLAARLPFAILPLGAFLGGLLTTFVLYRIATRQGRTSIATLLLAGIVLGALTGAIFGFLTFLSDDRQLRDLTFWTLGSLGGASWTKVSVIAPIVLVLVLTAPLLARGLNAMALGEAEAFHLGIPVQRIKIIAITLVACAVGAGVAATGMIGFVGIVVPHLLRMMIGANHKVLLPLSAIGGAILLLAADILARVIVAPAELPIGILTSALGAPFFLWLLLRRTGGLDT